jgi:hypothetical protein
MKIDGVTPLRPATTARRTERTGGANGTFSAHLETGEAAHVGASAGPALTRVDALLSLQEVPDALHSRRRAVRRGTDLLDQLEEIRDGLLMGAIPVNRLKTLAHMLKAERAATADPRLASLMDEIELRCAVELAKLGLDVD